MQMNDTQNQTYDSNRSPEWPRKEKKGQLPNEQLLIWVIYWKLPLDFWIFVNIYLFKDLKRDRTFLHNSSRIN